MHPNPHGDGDSDSMTSLRAHRSDRQRFSFQCTQSSSLLEMMFLIPLPARLPCSLSAVKAGTDNSAQNPVRPALVASISIHNVQEFLCALPAP